MLLLLKYPATHRAITYSAEGWKSPRVELDSGLFNVRDATRPRGMGRAARQSGVRASPVQVRRRGRAFTRHATSFAQCAASNIAPIRGFHARSGARTSHHEWLVPRKNLMHELLYQRIATACCCITVFLGDELVGEGTGFAISADGAVFTAAHVVTCRMPIRESDYNDPAIKIFAKFPGMPLIEYRAAICGIHITVDSFSEVVQIDQALLFPKQAVQFPFEPFTIGAPPKLGEEVFFAGYSDELELPFRVDRLLKPETVGAKEFFDAMQRGYRADMTGPMIKRGVAGNVRRIGTSEAATNTEIECEVFYVDNSMHCGASGGPIVNRDGLAVGVIVQRATTSASQSSDPRLLVPSGSTVALGLQTIPAMYRRLSGA
jgi:hypothetical protein